MKTNILVAKLVEGSSDRYRKVSSSGYITRGGEVCHPLAVGKTFGMTEEIHEAICRNALWLRDEPRANFVDLEGGWRVSLY